MVRDRNHPEEYLILGMGNEQERQVQDNIGAGCRRRNSHDYTRYWTVTQEPANVFGLLHPAGLRL